MAKIDLSYLDRFAGEPVRIESRVDPDYNMGKTSIENNGRIMRGNRWGRISFLEGFISEEDEKGRIVLVDMGDGVKDSSWSTAKGYLPGALPYLGNTQTVWEIERLKDKVLLFSHRQVGNSEYDILGAEQEVLGKLFVQFPYQTPYDPYSANVSKMMENFVQWRDDLVVPAKK